MDRLLPSRWRPRPSRPPWPGLVQSAFAALTALASLVACSNLSGPGASDGESGLADTPAAVVVRSNVYGDAVAIDGEVVGPSGPQAHAVTGGRHRIRVSKPGYAPWSTVIDVAPGEEQVVRAILTPVGDSAPATPLDGPDWSETVAYLGQQLRVGWGRGEPPSAFAVSDGGVMSFRVQSPADRSAWHHFSLDVARISVSLVEHLPSVVNLACSGAIPCIRQEICRDDDCSAAERIAGYKWFFDDDEHGRQVVEAFGHLIALTRRGAVPAKGRS